jgi:hypothetical protein
MGLCAPTVIIPDEVKHNRESYNQLNLNLHGLEQKQINMS